MKKWIYAAAASLLATIAVAEERHFVCVSDRDGSEVRLNRDANGDKGSIATAKVSGSATVFKGVGSMTFLHIENQDVMTFVVHFDSMTYDLSVQGPHAGNDHGTCQEVAA
ncbi:hypothetical protein [Ruegeria sp.]|uniref:hypothetical protein n=1 Tax=Ruegeria sp. TaxID=1879320 RepID=UPI003B5A9B89